MSNEKKPQQDTTTPGSSKAKASIGGGNQPPPAANPKADLPGTPLVLPRPDFRFPGNVGRTYLDWDKPQFPSPCRLRRVHRTLCLSCSMTRGSGSSARSAAIPSPTMDKLAAEGLRYNCFHTTALCSPTRAALITGRNHHNVASGVIGEIASGFDGYTAVLPKSGGSVGEVLRQNGYMTAWIGKNHNTPAWESSAQVRSIAGQRPRLRLLLRLQWWRHEPLEPNSVRDRNLVPASTDPNYYLTTDFADKAIGWVRKVKSISPDRPFFLYVAPGATHAPHHAPKEWIEKFKGKFDMGWDAYREETFARQLKLGVIPPTRS